MKRQSVVPKKKRGPSPTGKGTQVQVRLQPDLLTALDKFIRDEKRDLTRPEAIRELLAEDLLRRGVMNPPK